MVTLDSLQLRLLNLKQADTSEMMEVALCKANGEHTSALKRLREVEEELAACKAAKCDVEIQVKLAESEKSKAVAEAEVRIMKEYMSMSCLPPSASRGRSSD